MHSTRPKSGRPRDVPSPDPDRSDGNLLRQSTLPILVGQDEKEHLLLYIAATSQVVSVVLTVEREEQGKAMKIQQPIFCISEVLTPSK